LGAPIRAELIRAAVLTRYPELTSVRPLLTPVARTADPVLLAGAVEQWGQTGLRVRVHCRTTDECVPFYVAVSRDAAAGVPAAVNAPALPATTHAGSLVTMRIDSGHLHLTMPVTVLAAAPAGAEVRVQFHPAPLSAGGRPPQPHVFLATVVDAETVRGELP
jgi:hypothetical protein